MSSERRSIKPYGREWNSDRSAPDYDPQRDPCNPASPVFGQWPRRSVVRDLLREPRALVAVGAFVAWFGGTLSVIGLYHFGLISSDTVLIAWVGKYLLVIIALMIVGAWSLVFWFRNTPRGQRGPASRQALRRAPRFIAFMVGLTAACLVLDWLEKQHGVPFILSGGVVIALFFAASWLLERRKSVAEG